MKHILLILFPFLIFTASCKKEKLPDLPGTWQEVNEQPGFGGSVYHIIFDNGNFRLTKSLWSDIADTAGTPCAHSRIQYIHGGYSVSGNLLSLTGKYCDASFNADIPDCEMGAAFQEQHTMSGKDNWLILDEDRGDGDRIYLSRQ